MGDVVKRGLKGKTVVGLREIKTQDDGRDSYVITWVICEVFNATTDEEAITKAIAYWENKFKIPKDSLDLFEVGVADSEIETVI